MAFQRILSMLLCCLALLAAPGLFGQTVEEQAAPDVDTELTEPPPEEEATPLEPAESQPSSDAEPDPEVSVRSPAQPNLEFQFPTRHDDQHLDADLDPWYVWIFNIPLWGWIVIIALIAFFLGFVAALIWSDRRMRKRHGGFRIY